MDCSALVKEEPIPNALVMLGLCRYDIHTSCEELLFQGFATDSGLDDDLGDLSQLPAASTDDFSPWGRRCPKGG